MSKVEEVARALAEQRYMNIGGADSTALGKPAWVYCVPDALIAIEAMREPTEAMCKSGFPLWGGSYLKHVLHDLIPSLWRAMIDAALNEEG